MTPCHREYRRRGRSVFSCVAGTALLRLIFGRLKLLGGPIVCEGIGPDPWGQLIAWAQEKGEAPGPSKEEPILVLKEQAKAGEK